MQFTEYHYIRLVDQVVEIEVSTNTISSMTFRSELLSNLRKAETANTDPLIKIFDLNRDYATTTPGNLQNATWDFTVNNQCVLFIGKELSFPITFSCRLTQLKILQDCPSIDAVILRNPTRFYKELNVIINQGITRSYSECLTLINEA